MAYELPGLVLSLPANTDLSTKQYYFSQINSSGNVILNVTAGATVLGVQQNKPTAAGMATQVMTSGVTFITCGGTVAIGDLVASDSAGKAVAATKGTVDTTAGSDSVTGPLKGSSVVGTCIVAGSSGTLATILLQQVGAVATTAQ